MEIPSTLVAGFAIIFSAGYECLVGQECWYGVFSLSIAGILALMVLAGFLAWRPRSSLFAWTLLIALIAQIAAIIVWPNIH